MVVCFYALVGKDLDLEDLAPSSLRLSRLFCVLCALKGTLGSSTRPSLVNASMSSGLGTLLSNHSMPPLSILVVEAFDQVKRACSESKTRRHDFVL